MLTIKLKNGAEMRYRGTYDYYIDDKQIVITANNEDRVLKKEDIETIGESIPSTRTHVNSPIMLRFKNNS